MPAKQARSPIQQAGTGDLLTLEHDLTVELLRRLFGFFVAWAWPRITGAPYVPNAIADRIIATLQAVGDGTGPTQVLIACPPGVGKSTLLACYSAWRLARNPSHRAIHAGHSFDLVRTESLRVRRFVEGDDFRRMFPVVALRDDENTAGRWTTTKDGRYIATGTDGGLTGVRAHEAVLDDPLNAIDRSSAAARETLWRWFQEGLSTRLDGDRAPCIIVAQRLDRDDLIGRLIAQGGWFLVEIPAEDDDGNVLAPNVLPREKLDALKVTIGSAAYATQYKQQPNDDASAVVQRKWWNFHRPQHIAENTPRPSGCDTTRPVYMTPEHFSQIVIAVDMTFGGQKSTNDYAVVQAWGAVGHARYLLRQWRARATQMVQRAAIKAMREEFHHATIVVEKAAGGDGAVELLRAEGFTNVMGVTTGGKSKRQRLDLVSPSIEAGDCFLPLGAAWLSDYIEELAGATRHDDSQDATGYALSHLARHAVVSVPHGGWSGDDSPNRDVLDEIAAGGGPSWLDCYSTDPYR